MVASRLQLARAAGLVSLLFAVSRLLGLLREMVIGARFGTGAELDAYLAAFRLPDLIFYLAAGGALGSAFIPVFAASLARSSDADRAHAWRLASAVVNLVLLVTTALAALAALLARPLVVGVIAPGFAPEQQALTVALMRIMLLAPVIFGVSGIVMGILNSFQHFLGPALAPVVYNLAIIAAAWWLGPRLGATGLALGVVTGALLHLLVQVPPLVRRRPQYVATLGLDEAEVREVGRLMAPRVLGLAAVQINFLVNANLASRLPDGSLSALNYAWLMMLLPQGIVAQGLATALFPTFSAQAARGETDALRRTLNAGLRAVLWLTLPAAAGLLILREPLVQALFQRGEFTERSTAMTAYALAFFAFGLAAHSLLEVVTRAFYALHDTWTPVRVGLLAMALNVLLSLALLRPLAHGGLALANTVATTLETLALLWLIRPRLGGIGGRRLVGSLLRSLAATLGMAAALWPFRAWAAGWSPWWVAAGGIVLGAVVYGGLALALGREELASLRRRPRDEKA
ncbi:MAG: murein biosynthesis integral membrane protein MurJ [Caldilineales bacterium]|nr:murein biosynthesis integral membrane protein MurJ [Caldilineales bacterium]MDW8318952.1 murein biosynthesis integral membrane protein MurJ [Anaerolineae bacterium]